REIEDSTAQLTPIPVVACFASRTRMDNQAVADPARQLLMGMAVEHDIRVGLPEARQQGTLGMDIGAARLPWGRMHDQHISAMRPKLGSMRPAGEPFRQRRVDAVAGPGAFALRPERVLLDVGQE